MSNSPRYSFTEEGCIVTVTDLCTGSEPSVTNRAEEVIKTLHATIDLTGKLVQYYDTEGTLDRLLHEDGTFTGFAAGPWVEEDLDP